MCVLWNRRQCTNTKARMQNAYIQLLKHNAPTLMSYVCVRTYEPEKPIYVAAEISTREHMQSNTALYHTIPLIFCTLVMSVCLCVCVR